MRSEEIDLNNLILDPNNYRLQDEVGYRSIAADRYHLEAVQRATYQKLRSNGIRELRDSIVANGFLPIERIVVTPYLADDVDGKYLVIEGNRRVASLKQIEDEIQGGVDIPEGVRNALQAVPCVVVEAEGQDAYFRETLMGIRHVGGIKQWGGYQRAKLIADLRDSHGLESQEIAAKLGLSTREVNRRYRAFNALAQMRENDDYGDYAEPALYPLFHEAVAVPEVREWLSWNHQTERFDNLEQVATFYSLITPSMPEEGEQERAPKLKTYSDVRQLGKILPNQEARRFLFDADRPLVDALTVSNRDELTKKWRNEISEASSSLEGISAIEVRNLSQDDIELLNRLASAIEQVKEVFEAIRGRQ